MYRQCLVAVIGLAAQVGLANSSASIVPAQSVHGSIHDNIHEQALPSTIKAKMVEAGLSDEELSLWIEPLDVNIAKTPTQTITRQAPLVRHRADKLRTPASTQKLITTLIALHTLGENHHWLTRVYPKGMVLNGVLYGDLVIKGSGDPSMTHDRLTAMLEQVQKQGIRHIHGDIIIDNSVFSNVKYDINAFDGQGIRAYNAAPNAFLVNFGTVEVDVLPSGHDALVQMGDEKVITFIPADEQTAAVRVLPPLDDFDVPTQISANHTSCLNDGKFHLTNDKLTILSGTRAACGRQSYWLTFDDADTLAVKAVGGVWRSLDAKFTGRVRMGADASSPAIAWLSYPSRPLSEQIYLINQYSNNVMTEQVALSLPLSMPMAKQGAVSDYPRAFNFINKWWQTHLTTQPPIMSRASGLCRDCAIMTSAMAELLVFAYHQPNFEVFRESLPIAGQTGTMTSLSERDADHPAIGRAYVKTGTLNNVKSLAGYVMDTQGKWYAMVAIINAPDAGHDSRVTAVLDETLSYVATR